LLFLAVEMHEHTARCGNLGSLTHSLDEPRYIRRTVGSIIANSSDAKNEPGDKFDGQPRQRQYDLHSCSFVIPRSTSTVLETGCPPILKPQANKLLDCIQCFETKIVESTKLKPRHLETRIDKGNQSVASIDLASMSSSRRSQDHPP
jgi:hypothetical protein